MNYREKCSILAKEVAQNMSVKELREYMEYTVYDGAKSDTGMFDFWKEELKAMKEERAE